MSPMMQSFRRRAPGALAGALACAALLCAPALASPDQLSVLEDEHQMLELGPAAQTRSLDDAAALGADVIRANVIWSRIAPAPNSKRRPRRFDGKDPNAYPAGAWGPLDGLVAGAQARGLQLMLTPTGPIPAWASRCGGSVRIRRTCKPNPQLFGAFVRAVGTRYPSVKLWSIWNEPNQPGWLQPQYESAGGRLVPVAADLYRAVARSAIAGLRGTGHRADQILLGETSPIGRFTSSPRVRPVPPQQFIAELFCLNSRGRRLRGATARARHCTRPGRFAVTGFAHHPYTRGGSRPPLSKPGRGEITVGSASRLTRLLDQAAKAKRIPPGLPVWYTENGWQTNPPDRIFGVLPAQQAEYINQSDWISYRNPRVVAVAQYKLIDDVEQGSFQSGLRLTDGSVKPSYAAYKLPIWVSGTGAELTVYGQVRPAPDGAALQVEIQNAPSAGAAFRTVQVVPVSSLKGTFTAAVPAMPGIWRLRSSGLVSRQAEATPR